MQIACLDFEGVLVPEIWVNLAEKTGVDDLKVTTRDIVDYDELMEFRLGVLRRNHIGLKTLQEAASSLNPLPGAKEFLHWLRQHYQVAIVSDTFYELCAPLVQKLDYPMILCHRLQFLDDEITGYKLRQKDPKRKVVLSFQSIAYDVVATGDSYNDISMLEQSDKATLFNPSDKVMTDYPNFPVAKDYKELKTFFTSVLNRD